MFIKKKKPVTSGQRHAVLLDSSFFQKYNRIKSNSFRKRLFSGRNSTGQICIYNKGSRKNRFIAKTLLGYQKTFLGVVLLIEKSIRINKMFCRVFSLTDKKYYYMPYVKGVKPGCIVSTNTKLLGFRTGSLSIIKDLPVGSFVSGLVSNSTLSNKIAISSGSSAQILKKDSMQSIVRLPSGRIKTVSNKWIAYLGSSGFPSSFRLNIGKAGRNRNIGKRPNVRGVAMNPVDHPHGGGEGKTSGGRPSVTPWGRPTKGKPTAKIFRKN